MTNISHPLIRDGPVYALITAAISAPGFLLLWLIYRLLKAWLEWPSNNRVLACVKAVTRFLLVHPRDLLNVAATGRTRDGNEDMNRRRILLIAPLPLAIAAVIGVLGALPPRLGVTKANFDRIEVGMSKTEIEAILGPPTTYTPDKQHAEWTELAMMHWESRNGAATVTIALSDGCATNSMGWRGPNGNIIDKIRRWLHLD